MKFPNNQKRTKYLYLIPIYDKFKILQKYRYEGFENILCSSKITFSICFSSISLINSSYPPYSLNTLHTRLRYFLANNLLSFNRAIDNSRSRINLSFVNIKLTSRMMLLAVSNSYVAFLPSDSLSI